MFCGLFNVKNFFLTIEVIKLNALNVLNGLSNKCFKNGNFVF